MLTKNKTTQNNKKQDEEEELEEGREGRERKGQGGVDEGEHLSAKSPLY